MNQYEHDIDTPIIRVKELIERLQQEDPDKKVLLHDGRCFFGIGVIGPPTKWVREEYLHTELGKDEQDSLVIGVY
jgi:hypothetical protein